MVREKKECLTKAALGIEVEINFVSLRTTSIGTESPTRRGTPT